MKRHLFTPCPISFHQKKRGLAVSRDGGSVSWGSFRGCVSAPRAVPAAHLQTRVGLPSRRGPGKASGQDVQGSVCVHSSGHSCMSKGAPMARPTVSPSGRARGLSVSNRRAWIAGRSQARARITRLLSSRAATAMRTASGGETPRALTTQAIVDCGGAAGGRGMQGIALVLSCQERQRRRSHPSTTLSRRLRVAASRGARTGAGSGEGAGVHRAGTVSSAWRREGGCWARAAWWSAANAVRWACTRGGRRGSSLTTFQELSRLRSSWRGDREGSGRGGGG